MHLRSGRIFVQTALPTCVLLPSPHLRNYIRPDRKGTAEVKLSIPRLADNKTKEKRTRGENRLRSRPTLTLPRVAKSSKQLTNISMGITLSPREMEIISLTGGISIQSPNWSSQASWPGYSLTLGLHYTSKL